MSQQFHDDDVIPHGGEIVERFGGIRPMASKLNVPVTTVQGWKKRDAIPAIRREEILTAAATYDVNLKGLLGENANQNSRIAEDPALASASNVHTFSTPGPQAEPQRPTYNPNSNLNGAIDMRQIKSAARRTSMITSVAMIAIVGGAALLLFGGSNKNASQNINALEGRVSTLEQQSAKSQPGMISQAVTALSQRVDQLSASGSDVSARLAALEQQLRSSAPALADVAQQAQSLAASPEGQQTLQTAVDDLRNLVTGLQGRMDNVDQALAQAKQQNDALGQTLNDVSGRDLGAAAMLLTLTSIRTSIDRQTPFADDLTLLRQLAGNTDPELAASIDKMAPYAQDGVLSPQVLKRELQASANDIITAKLKGEDVSIKDKIMGRLKGLFSIKKDGQEVGGSQERALIDQASAQLDAGDVKAAMATLNQLEGPAAAAAQPWQQQAAGTVAAQDLQAQMITSIMGKIKSSLSSLKASSAGGIAGSAPINMAPVQAPAPADPIPAPETRAMTRPDSEMSQPLPMPETEIIPQAGTPTPSEPLPYPGEPGQRSGVIIQQ